MSLSLAIKGRALAGGFDLVGIAPTNVWKDLEFSRRWVEQGFGGEMHYLDNPKRHDPRRLLSSVRSVICVGLVYNAPLPYSTEVRRAQGSRQKEVGSGIGESQRAKIKRQKSKIEALDGSRVEIQGSGWEAQENKPSVEARRVSSSEFGVWNLPEMLEPEGGGPRAWISRYAWGKDYHEVMRTKLEKLRGVVEALAPGVETRVYVDTGPIVERAFARYSGVGWVGKNTCLINEGKGSWFFLGAVLTNLELAPDLPAPDRCGSCTRCLDACPTGALVEPYVMDASRCIAYFTIELRGSIPAEFRSAIGANVFGCDICQDVCPWNSKSRLLVSGAGCQSRNVATTRVPEFQPLRVPCRGESPCSPELQNDSPTGDAASESFSLFNPPLEKLADLSEQEFWNIFRHSPIKRAKYRGWLRNLCVAMGNSGDKRFVARLQQLCNHSDPVICEHAAWALEQLHRQAEGVPPGSGAVPPTP